MGAHYTSLFLFRTAFLVHLMVMRLDPLPMALPLPYSGSVGSAIGEFSPLPLEQRKELHPPAYCALSRTLKPLSNQEAGRDACVPTRRKEP